MNKYDPLAKTGIKTDSPFNKIDGFHVTDVPYCDLMHDWFIGVAHYCMCSILQNILLDFNKTDGLFTLSFLNNEKENFLYGAIDKKYKTVAIRGLP